MWTSTFFPSKGAHMKNTSSQSAWELNIILGTWYGEICDQILFLDKVFWKYELWQRD